MMLLLALGYAAEPAPTPAPAAAPVEAPSPEVAPGEEPLILGDDAVDEVVIVNGDLEVRKAREALALKLRAEGYKRSERKGDYVVYKPDIPYHPQVWVHDDGWVSLRRQPPRVHSPGHAFADQGSPLNYLWCIPTAMTACVSLGGWTISKRKYSGIKSDLLDAMRPEVRKLNDAVVRNHLGQRIYKEIPTDLDKIWSDASQPAELRRRLLFLYWDSRVENEAGFAAKKAIAAFIVGVVQVGPDAFTAPELSALNAERQSLEPLKLPGLAEVPVPEPVAPPDEAPAP